MHENDLRCWFGIRWRDSAVWLLLDFVLIFAVCFRVLAHWLNTFFFLRHWCWLATDCSFSSRQKTERIISAHRHLLKLIFSCFGHHGYQLWNPGTGQHPSAHVSLSKKREDLDSWIFLDVLWWGTRALQRAHHQVLTPGRALSTLSTVGDIFILLKFTCFLFYDVTTLCCKTVQLGLGTKTSW